MPPDDIALLFDLIRGLDTKIQGLTSELRKENEHKISALNTAHTEALKECQKERCDPRHHELKNDVKTLQRTIYIACGGFAAISYIIQLALKYLNL